MPYDNAIIPPVRAGTIESSLEFEYDENGFNAVGEHCWMFDGGAYADRTGLDLGRDYPYVRQENGHTLRIRTEYSWGEYERDGEKRYSLDIEQEAVRGITSIDTVFYTRCGYYRLDSELNITRSGEERQQWRVRERIDKDIPHYDTPDLDGLTVDNGEQLVRGLHNGRWGPTVEKQLHDVIVRDCPDDALSVDEYDHTSEPVASADD